MEVAKKERQKRRRGQVVPLGGGSFKIRVPLGRDAAGRRKYHTETLHDTTPADADDRCKQLLKQVDSGEYFEPSRTTLKEFIEREWLPQKEREGVRVASSMKAYRGVASRYIIPAIGHLPLARVTPKAVQELYNRMQDAGRYDATMKPTRNVLGMVFRQAVLWRYLRANPAEGIKLPKAKNPPRAGRAFSRHEALRFIKAASEEPGDLAYLFHLFTGLRPEELAGLGWQHISFDEQSGCGVARVERAVLWPTAREFVFAPPKTESGRRLVFFPGHIHRALEAHRAEQAARALRLGALWRECGLVFPRATGEPLDVRSAYAKRLRLLAARAEIKGRVTPYTLRYSFATLALLAGELDVSVSRQMGHAHPDFTKDVYVKVLPEMQQSLSGLFERLLSEAAGNQLAHLDAPGVM
ncbi:MAG TPA: site-specific integrase [Pyrinomonadaceae bacterium]|jgi:integrase|nr:site-specific integrase [Pyrinomonadaceae bacterium]